MEKTTHITAAEGEGAIAERAARCSRAQSTARLLKVEGEEYHPQHRGNARFELPEQNALDAESESLPTMLTRVGLRANT